MLSKLTAFLFYKVENPTIKVLNRMIDNDEEVKKDQPASTDQPEVEKEDAEPTAVPDASQGETKTDEEEGIDYKAELVRLAQERDNYKEGMLIAKAKLKESPKVKEEEEEPAGQPAEEEVYKKAQEIAKAEVNTVVQQLTQDTFDEELNGLTSDPDERELIKFHYENSLQKSGYSRKAIKSDLETAQVLANKKKLTKQISEMRQTMRTKQTITNSGMGSNQDKPDVTDQAPKKLSEADRAFMQRHGIKSEDVKWSEPNK
jgi:hypothetical protein